VKRLWQLLDEVPHRASRGSAMWMLGIVASSIAALGTLTSNWVLGVQLPFLCGIVVVMIVTATIGIAGALATSATNLAFFLVMMRLGTMPFVTLPNILFVEFFSLCIAIIGGLLRRKQVEHLAFAQRLEQREAHLQSIFDHLPAAIVIVDKAGKVCAINAGGCALFETTPEAAFSRRLSAFVEIEDAGGRDIAAILADLSPDASDASVNAAATTATGRRRALRLSAAYVPSSEGRWLTVYLRDQTEATTPRRSSKRCSTNSCKSLG
jgi:two-component system, LuxR family, sensor kinase FixL